MVTLKDVTWSNKIKPERDERVKLQVKKKEGMKEKVGIRRRRKQKVRITLGHQERR